MQKRDLSRELEQDTSLGTLGRVENVGLNSGGGSQSAVDVDLVGSSKVTIVVNLGSDARVGINLISVTKSEGWLAQGGTVQGLVNVDGNGQLVINLLLIANLDILQLVFSQSSKSVVLVRVSDTQAIVVQDVSTVLWSWVHSQQGLGTNSQTFIGKGGGGIDSDSLAELLLNGGLKGLALLGHLNKGLVLVGAAVGFGGQNGRGTVDNITRDNLTSSGDSAVQAQGARGLHSLTVALVGALP